MKEYTKIPKKKSFVYRGISYQEFVNAQSNGYFQSSSTFGTYASDEPYTAECYAAHLAPTGKVPSLTKPTYVIAFSKKNLNIIDSKNIDSFIKFCKKLNLITKQKPVLYWQMLFKEYVSGDDHLIIGKIPFKQAKEIYKFSVGKWVKIK